MISTSPQPFQQVINRTDGVWFPKLIEKMYRNVLHLYPFFICCTTMHTHLEEVKRCSLKEFAKILHGCLRETFKEVAGVYVKTRVYKHQHEEAELHVVCRWHCSFCVNMQESTELHIIHTAKVGKAQIIMLIFISRNWQEGVSLLWVPSWADPYCLLMSLP